MSGETHVIELSGLCFSYPDGGTVLANADLSIRAGEAVGLVGDIGSGKTTLLHMIVGLLRPDGGRVTVFDAPRREECDFWEVRERVGLLFQDAEDQLFCPTVREDVAFGPLNQGKSREDVASLVTATLARVGLEGYEDRVTHHLSGGEKRLVSLATVLAMQPDVLLLDEPENGLDPASYARLQSLLISLPQAKIVVSHNVDFLQAVARRRVRLQEGGLVNVAAPPPAPPRPADRVSRRTQGRAGADG